MKEMIESILQEEQEAQKIVEQARKTALRLQQESDLEIQKKKDELKKEVRRIISGTVEQAQDQASHQTVPEPPSDLQELLTELGISRSSFDKMAEKIRNMLIRPDLP